MAAPGSRRKGVSPRYCRRGVGANGEVGKAVAAAIPPLAVYRIRSAQTEMWLGTGLPSAEVTLIAVGLRDPLGVQWR